MLKFEYHYQDKFLFIQEPGQPSRQINQGFTTNWDAPGFILDPVNHWITFTTYPNRITAFYKQVQEESGEVEVQDPNLKWADWVVSAKDLTPISQKITYYQKDLPKTDPVTFTFAPQDQVHKENGVWVKKHRTK
jgi:hypothetical protein